MQGVWWSSGNMKTNTLGVSQLVLKVGFDPMCKQMEGGVEKPKPCKHRTKVEIDADKVAKVVIVGSVLGLGFERTKFFGEEKSEAWKGEIKSPCNMEKPSQKTKEVKNLSNSNDDLNESLSKPS